MEISVALRTRQHHEGSGAMLSRLLGEVVFLDDQTVIGRNRSGPEHQKADACSVYLQ